MSNKKMQKICILECICARGCASFLGWPLLILGIQILHVVELLCWVLDWWLIIEDRSTWQLAIWRHLLKSKQFFLILTESRQQLIHAAHTGDFILQHELAFQLILSCTSLFLDHLGSLAVVLVGQLCWRALLQDAIQHGSDLLCKEGQTPAKEVQSLRQSIWWLRILILLQLETIIFQDEHTSLVLIAAAIVGRREDCYHVWE